MSEFHSSNRRGRLGLGVGLVFLGLLFIGEELRIIQFTWPMILVIMGAATLVDAIANKKKSSIFPGTFLLLLGLIFFADDVYWLRGGVGNNWPLILIAIGVSFLTTFLYHPANRGTLVPAGILIGVGLLFLLTEYRVLRWSALYKWFDFWPIALIGVGVWLIIRKRD